MEKEQGYIIYYDNGDIYEGYWKNNKMDGKGIIYYKNGDREIGDYSEGKEIGKHVLITKTGKVTFLYY